MTNSTTWTLYTSNPEAWSAMLTACKEAKETIDLENFIFTADEIGNQFIDVCARRASQGVKVRFIWDAAGSFSFFGSSIIEDLKKKDIELVFFKTLLPSFFALYDYRSWYFRNHHRTLVVDGKIGFTGSVSVSKRMEKWRDTSVRIEGPVVKDIQTSFERMWMRAHGRRMRQAFRATKRNTKSNNSEFEYVTNSPLPGKRYLYRRMIEAIRKAQKSIYITVPYFVPTHKLSRALHLAVRRGVDVAILLPESSDSPTVDLGARTFFHSMLKAGIKIYLYRGRMIHNKTVVVDRYWASVGTLNFDHISLLHNFEANLVTYNSRFADELISHFTYDLENSHEVILDEWKRRFFVEKIATFFVKFIRSFL